MRQKAPARSKLRGAGRRGTSISQSNDFHKCFEGLSSRRKLHILWQKVMKRYEAVDTLLVIDYQEKLLTIKQRDCSSLDEYLRQKMDIFNKLQDANSPLDNVTKIQQILCGLDDKYIRFKLNINESLASTAEKDSNAITTKLCNYEHSTLNITQSEGSDETALYSNKNTQSQKTHQAAT
jgi:hypothetical protein